MKTIKLRIGPTDFVSGIYSKALPLPIGRYRIVMTMSLLEAQPDAADLAPSLACGLLGPNGFVPLFCSIPAYGTNLVIAATDTYIGPIEIVELIPELNISHNYIGTFSLGFVLTFEEID